VPLCCRAQDERYANQCRIRLERFAAFVAKHQRGAVEFVSVKPETAKAFMKAKAEGADVDKTVLADPDVSNLGRFAVDNELSSMGAFKTPTLRNVALTAPYMHDGSIETLRDVVVHYNNGGVTNEGDHVNDFLSGGIRPLNLDDQQIDDLVAFMEALTSPALADLAGEPGTE